MTLTEFLLARIAEDEAAAPTFGHCPYREDDFAGTHHTPERVLAECDAKRRIVEWVQQVQSIAGDPPGFDSADAHALDHVLRLLALPYADHPEFQEQWTKREEWKP